MPFHVYCSQVSLYTFARIIHASYNSISGVRNLQLFNVIFLQNTSSIFPAMALVSQKPVVRKASKFERIIPEKIIYGNGNACLWKYNKR